MGYQVSDVVPKNMNGEAASWLMHHLDDGDLDVGHASEETKEWLEGLGLEMNLLRFLQWGWPRKDCQIGPVAINPMAAVRDEEDLEVFLAHKLIPVGNGPNGDTFVIDFSVDSCPVGFVTHEEYYGEGDPRPYFQGAGRSIESFLYRVSEGRFFPCDYYVTEAFNEFLKDEATHEQFPPYKPIKAQQGVDPNA